MQYSGQSVLSVRGVSKRFDGLIALDNVSFDLESGVCGLIGPNGAGKTTLLNVISGTTESCGGSIWMYGTRIDRKRLYQIARLGIVRTFQNSLVFPTMTVYENIAVGWLERARDLGSRTSIWSSPTSSIDCLEAVAMAAERMGIPHLLPKHPDEITFGQRKMMEMARALIQCPRLLLLDEPSVGLSPAEREKLVDIILQLSLKNTSILVVAHDLELVSSVSTRVLVLSGGKLIADDGPEEVMNNPEVQECYIGTTHVA